MAIMFTKGHGAKELVRFDALCKLFSVKIYTIQIKLSVIALSSYFWSIATVKTHKRSYAKLVHEITPKHTCSCTRAAH